MPIDLRQIRYLIAAAEAGSISAAARELYVTQPALTTALRKLEQSVGVPLMHRHYRGVELTAAGEAFVQRAGPALEAVEEASQYARRVGGSGRRELIIALLPATLTPHARTLIQAFRAQNPEVEVRYRELSYITHTSDLMSGRADVAFLWPPYTETELHFLPISQEPRMLGVASSDPLAEREAVVLDDILDRRFPGYHQESSGGWFEGWFFDEQRCGPATLTADDAATPFEMALVVQEGQAIAPAAQSFALAFPTSGVRWLSINDAPPATLALAWRPRSHNPATDAFVQLTRAHLDLSLATRSAAP